MTDLFERLERLGLSQYYPVLVAEGFDTWDTILDITESDLSELGVKLGHRRKLQRAIAESRGQSSTNPLPASLSKDSSLESYKSDDSAAEGGRGVRAGDTTGGGPPTNVKRKYRRHPKADENAPERPPSAYVIFSNQVRESLKGQTLSFTEIAKVVGERWQTLSPDQKEPFETQASTLKERYYAQLGEYKKTQHFQDYQKYLADFRAKHGRPTASELPTVRDASAARLTQPVDSKRSRLEGGEASGGSSQSSGRAGRGQSLPHRHSGSTQWENEPDGHERDESTPPPHSAVPSIPSISSKSTSPSLHVFSGLHSPADRDHFPTGSSIQSYPRALPREGFPPLRPPASYSRDADGVPPPHLPLRAPFSQLDHVSSRRSERDAPLPALTHEETTLSSTSSSHASLPPRPTPPNLADYPFQKPPFPSPSSGGPPPLLHPAATSPTTANAPTSGDPRRPTLPGVWAVSQGQSQDPRQSPSLAALLRAGELARDADRSQEQGGDRS